MRSEKTRADRKALVADMFPDGITRLWCPPLTHFLAPGLLDVGRIHAHLDYITESVKGILVPGSTGEGWEMDNGEVIELLGVVLQAVRDSEVNILVGVLKTETDAMLRCLDGTLEWLRRRAGTESDAEAMAAFGVVGFVVCPPAGADLSQQQIARCLSEVLERGLPTALYQLPQVTGNEVSAQTVHELAADHPNFFLLKDSSGEDRVALSPLDLGGVFLVRGAEGGYARWPKRAGGPYDGMLLSTANTFPRELRQIITHLDLGQPGKAQQLAGRVERVIDGCFELVADFPTGNKFTNANKVLDHIMAWGLGAAKVEPPMLHGGEHLPADLVPPAMDLLKQSDLLPLRGYLEP
jgi:dihydrodipicolinate synthase/N-acetylneuraminate lyase